MVSLSLSKSEEEGVFFPLFFYYFTNFMVLSIVTRDKNDKNDKNEIKKQVIYLYDFFDGEETTLKCVLGCGRPKTRNV